MKRTKAALKRSNLSLRLAPEMEALLRAGARAAGVSLTQIIEECLEAKAREVIDRHLHDHETARSLYAKLKTHKSPS